MKAFLRRKQNEEAVLVYTPVSVSSGKFEFPISMDNERVIFGQLINGVFVPFAGFNPEKNTSLSLPTSNPLTISANGKFINVSPSISGIATTAAIALVPKPIREYEGVVIANMQKYGQAGNNRTIYSTNVPESGYFYVLGDYVGALRPNKILACTGITISREDGNRIATSSVGIALGNTASVIRYTTFTGIGASLCFCKIPNNKIKIIS